jgi:hypothetical protein
VDLSKFSRDDLIIGGLALLLLIDLLFLPWFDVSVGNGLVSISVTSTATGDPDAIWGILAALVTTALILDLALDRLGVTELPAIGGSRANTRFILAVVAIGLLAVKFILNLDHFSDLGFGFWAAVVLGGGLIFVALQARTAETGVGGSTRSSGGTAAPPPPPAAPSGSSAPPPA